MMEVKKYSSIWGQISDFKNFSKDIQEVAKKGIRVKVGSGAQTRFWLDLWTGDENLKSMFPRLFLLSKQKDELIEKMGEWDTTGWKWTFLWRRKLFVWEEDLLGDLLVAVNRISLKANKRDVRGWGSDFSPFLVSNFVLQVSEQAENRNSYMRVGRLAWRNLAPPRAQLQVWFLLHGRLNTKERLFKFGVTGLEDDKCVFCNEESESIEHLFFGCKVAAELWYYCCNRWGLSFSLPNRAESCFLSWLGAPFARFDKKIWISMFYVVAWSIWDIRNKIIFQKYKPNWDFEKKRLFWRLGSWICGWSPGFPFSPEQFLDNLNDIRKGHGLERTQRAILQ